MSQGLCSVLGKQKRHHTVSTGRSLRPLSVVPGCGALYRSSWRNGIELTTEGARAGYTNSVAAKSPEELLRMNRRGAKLKLPGSLKENRAELKTTYTQLQTTENKT